MRSCSPTPTAVRNEGVHNRPIVQVAIVKQDANSSLTVRFKSVATKRTFVTTMDSSKDSGAGAHAHHITEFGDVENIVHVDKNEDAGSAVGSLSVVGKKQVRRLRKRTFRKRHLQQHFAGDILYRTIGTRTVSQDELFLDLIIVANSTYTQVVCASFACGLTR